MYKSTSKNLKRIAIAVSGGVDSSVAAYILKQSVGKNNVFGLHMSNWNSSDEDSHTNYCEQSDRDANDAQKVCDSLGIHMDRVDFVSEYWNGVFEPFVKALGEQRMVNPDVGCNTIVKFGVMREYAMKKGATHVATGHYARLWHRNNNGYQLGCNSNSNSSSSSSSSSSSNSNSNSIHQSGLESDDQNNELLVQSCVAGLPEEEWICEWGKKETGMTFPLLLSGADLSKDQSYFLCNVNGHGLSNALFPLGDLIKKSQDVDVGSTNQISEGHDSNDDDSDDDCENELKFMSVRDIAQKAGLSTASKKESMGICFIGKRKFADFISQYLPHVPQPGNFVDIDTGEVVGKHDGSAHFTIGQGAKISGANQKWFINKKDADGTVFVCNSTHHPSLYSNELYVQIDQFNWIAGELPPPLMKKEGRTSIPALSRTRHLQPLIPCVISIRRNSYVVIQFDRPVRAITPGQTVAIYVGKGLICLGGGQIWNHGPTYHELGVDLPLQLHPAGNNDLSVHHRTQ
jgi:tRNA U34 2-thiouridine synthase MnmA/TrmU